MSHIDRRAGIGTALEILLYSAVFCIVVLIPICVTSHNNAALNNVNNTYVKIDNLAMGNIPVCSIFLQGPTHRFIIRGQNVNCVLVFNMSLAPSTIAFVFL
jgi:hypothetical protein